MEILLLAIYAFFVWLIFIKLKWLPWTFVSQVVVVTLPIVALTVMILVLNIVAPSSHDIRVINYVVPVVPRVTGRVIEVPVEPNRPVKKGDVLFRIDPTPFQYQVDALVARLEADEAQVAADEAGTQAAEARLASERATAGSAEAGVVTADAGARELEDSLVELAGRVAAARARLDLSRKRAEQYAELATSGAGDRFAHEQALADVTEQEANLVSAIAAESQVKQQLSARIDGELSSVASAKSQRSAAQARVAVAEAEVHIASAQLGMSRAQVALTRAQLLDARWQLEQTVYYAPADGTVVALALRPGAVASVLVTQPVMTFVEEEQWVLAIYHQNEVRYVKEGQEGEIAFEMYPGYVAKCRVDSIMWATAQGQLPIGTAATPAGGGVAPIPPDSVAVRLLMDGRDKDLFLAAGAHGSGAIYTDRGSALHILRKVLVRVGSKLNWFVLKLH